MSSMDEPVAEALVEHRGPAPARDRAPGSHEAHAEAPIPSRPGVAEGAKVEEILRRLKQGPRTWTGPGTEPGTGRRPGSGDADG